MALGLLARLGGMIRSWLVVLGALVALGTVVTLPFALAGLFPAHQVGQDPPLVARPPDAPVSPSPAGSDTVALDPVDRYLPWAQALGPRAGIPARALAAYGAAHVQLQRESPTCRLSWSTLAGIGWVESAHGWSDNTRLGSAGQARPAIVGPVLDGSNSFGRIPDTDQGRLDGDTAWDHAVGPLQFIPSSWKRWAADGDGDGVKNPQDIDDAALAAARYLCASGADLGTSQGWVDAVMSYNHSADYVRNVNAAAETYAIRSS